MVVTTGNNTDSAPMSVEFYFDMVSLGDASNFIF
jgi:hypothetical protein